MGLAWHYLLIFFGVAIEGPGVTLTAAALAGAGYLDPLVVFLCAAFGNLASDVNWYCLGYFGHFEGLLQRLPFFAPLTPQIEQIKEKVAQNAPRMLLIAKLALGVASIPTLVAAGMVHVRWQRFLWLQVLGEVIWSGTLVLVGVFLGQYVSQLEKDLRIAGLIGGVLFVLLLIWAVRYYFKPTTQATPDQAEH